MDPTPRVTIDSETYNIARNIGGRTFHAVERLGSVDATQKEALANFLKGSGRLLSITNKSGVRTCVIQDRAQIELGDPDKKVLDECKFSGAQRTGTVYYDDKGDLKSGREGSQGQITLYNDDEGHLFRACFHYPNKSDEELNLIEEQGFNKLELRVISLVAKFNKLQEDGRGREFNVSYSNNKGIIDTSWVGDLKGAVPDFFVNQKK